MDTRQLHGTSDYLGGEDLKPQAEHVLVIIKAAMETLGQGPRAEDKLVLSFERSKKRLALNAGNIKVLENLYGYESDAWVGKQIVLFRIENVQNPQTNDFGPALRLKPPALAAGGPVAAAVAPAVLPPPAPQQSLGPDVVGDQTLPGEDFDDDIPF